MSSDLVKPTNGTISFDIIGSYKPENSKALFIQAIMISIAGKPLPMPDPAKFIFKEVSSAVENYSGAKLELSWKKNSNDTASFSGKITYLDNLVLASFA